MPSLFSKFTGGSKHKNPYANPHHPSHAPLPGKPTTSAQPLPSASPRGSHDYLAEARELANRDPVTGRRQPQPNMPQPASQSRQSGPSAEGSAYQAHASQTKQTTGSRYDLFSSQERERMEREEKIRIARGRTEFYAPERRLEEFYSEPVRY